MSICPECEQGKHDNCTGWALDSEDRDVECMCKDCRQMHELARIFDVDRSSVRRIVRACRVCGCTDERACLPPCHWVEQDLCSACLPKEAKP